MVARSPGGLTSKVHLVADDKGHLVGWVFTGGNITDSKMKTTVLDGIRLPRATGRPGLRRKG